MPVTSDKPAPYAPGSAILALIRRFRSHGLPTPINSDVLARAGISESLIPRTLQALQLLDLTDDQGIPTTIFEGLRRAPESEFTERLKEWVKGAYPEVFDFVDPLKDDDTRIRDAFRGYQPHGQQARMVTLFQVLASAAGLRPDKHTPSRAPVLRERKPRPLPRVSNRRSADDLQSGNRAKLPPALEGLLASLPSENEGWTKETRDKFMTTFAAVLDFCFPVVHRVVVQKENGGHD